MLVKMNYQKLLQIFKDVEDRSKQDYDGSGFNLFTAEETVYSVNPFSAMGQIILASWSVLKSATENHIGRQISVCLNSVTF